MIDDLEQALYASKMVSYAQGYQLMRAVAAEQGWRLNYGGCEVVSVPILLFRKRYPTYCIPLVALDAVEKAIVERG